MHVLRDAEAIKGFLASHHDTDLLKLISSRLQDLSEYADCDVAELVNFLVADAGDAIEQVNSQLGFPILCNRFNEAPFGSPGFTPSWDDLVAHEAWYEFLYVLSDDGFGLVVFVSKYFSASTELLCMCAQYARNNTKEVLDL